MAFFELSRDGFVGVDPNEKLPHELPPPSRDVAFNGKMQRSSKVDGLTLAQRNAALRKSKSDLYTSLDEQERELRERESRRLAVKLAKQQQYQTAIYGQPEAKAKQKYTCFARYHRACTKSQGETSQGSSATSIARAGRRQTRARGCNTRR
eukprot:TRINITY_DN7276_c0_g1_i4.p1 TRINITY_DN7276_c0_g1~~TRINITY_DN7276_c0_g1_i4.p1  ORF type:complete len:151 (+),score=14.94 TRINITY_DN7276_c0_g1_i4:117-569(+)